MDLFELGIALKTEQVDAALSKVKTELMETGQVATRSFETTQYAITKTATATAALATTTQTATGLIDRGFRGNAQQVLATAAAVDAANRRIASLRGKMGAMVRNSDDPEKTKRTRAYRALEKQVDLEQQLKVQILETANAKVASEQAIGNAIKKRSAEEKAAALATKQAIKDAEQAVLQAEASRQAAVAKTKALEAERVAGIRAIEAAVQTSTAIQLEAQQLLQTNLAFTQAQAEKYAATIVAMRELGADEQRIVEYKMEREQLSLLTAATERDAEANLRRQAILNAPARRQEIVESGTHDMMLKKEMLEALERGYARTAAEARVYATRLIELKAVGGSKEQIITLQQESAGLSELNAQISRTTTLKREQTAIELEKQAAERAGTTIAKIALSEQLVALERLRIGQAFVTEGLVESNAAALQLATAYSLLKDGGMTEEESLQWKRNQQDIEQARIALERYIEAKRRAAGRIPGSPVPGGRVPGGGGGGGGNNPPPTNPWRIFGGTIDGVTGKFRNLEHGVTRVRTGLFSVMSIIAILGLDRMVRGLIEADKLTNQFHRSLDIVTGSSEATSRSLAMVNENANRLGIEYKVLAENFTKFAVAAQGLLTLGETEEVFIGVSEALRALGKDQVDTERVFKALEQMVGKGTVSMEELRGQLSESLPVAMRVMARELGITRGQLMEMVARGLLPASKAVKALGRGLHEDFAEAAIAAARTVPAALARVENAFFDLYATVMTVNGGSQRLMEGLESLTETLNDPVVRESIENLILNLVKLIEMILKNIEAIGEFAKNMLLGFATYAAVSMVLNLAGALATLFKTLAAFSSVRALLIIIGGFVGMTAAPAVGVLLGVAAAAAAVYGTFKLFEAGWDWVFEGLDDETNKAIDNFDKLTVQMDRVLKLREQFARQELAAEQGLEGISTFSSEALAGVVEIEDLRRGQEVLLKVGVDYAELDELPDKTLLAVAKAQKDMDAAKLQLSLFRGRAIFDPGAQTGGEGSTGKEYADSLKRREDTVRQTQDLYDKAIANSRLAIEERKRWDAEQDARQESRQDAAEEAAQFQNLMRKKEESVASSRLAMEMLRSGYAETMDSAEEYAEFYVKAMGLTNGANREEILAMVEKLRLKDEELKSIKEMSDAIVESIRLRKELNEESKERAEFGTIVTDTRIRENFDVEGAANRNRVEIERLNVTERTLEKEQEIRDTTFQIFENKRRELAQQDLILDRLQKQGEMVGLNMERDIIFNSVEGNLDLDLDADFLREQIEQLERSNALTDKGVENAILMEKAFRQVNAQIAYGNKLRDVRREARTEKVTRDVLTSKSFRNSRVDFRKVTELVEQKKLARPGMTDDMYKDAIKDAVELVKLQEDMIERTERMAEAARTSADVWGELIDKWSTSVPLITQMDQAFADMADTFLSSIGDSISSVVMGFEEADVAAKQLAQTILSQLIAALIEMALRAAITKIFGEKDSGNDDIAKIEALAKAQITAATEVAGTSMALMATEALVAKSLTPVWSELALQMSMASWGASAIAGMLAWKGASTGGAASGGGAMSDLSNLDLTIGTSLDGARATGGPVRGGGSYLVGEEGPEIFSPGSSGTIANNDDTMDFLKASSAPVMPKVTNEVSVPVSIEVVNNLGVKAKVTSQETTGPDGQKLITMVLNAVADDVARNGRVGQSIGSRFAVSQRLGTRS